MPKANFLDYGNDWNKDKHCDLEGWFVDKDGNHRADERTYKKDDSKYELIDSHYKKIDFEKVFDNISVSDTENDALIQYSCNKENKPYGCPKINKFLRFGVDGSYELLQHIRMIDNAISKSNVKRDFQVFRGINLDQDIKYSLKLLKLKEGDIMTDNGFFSTSFNPYIPMKYANKDGNNYAIFDIDIKSGKSAFPLFLLNTDEDEMEILLPRNTKFKINKIGSFYDKEKFIIVYFMEVL